MDTNRAHTGQYPSAAYAWLVCIVLLIAYVFSFLDRSIISLLVIPIEHDLGLSDTEVSLLQGFSFALFYALLGFPIARRVDSGSRRAVIAWGILAWSLMTAACGLASRFWHLFLARVGVGAGEAALLPGAVSLLADCFPPRRRGLALGIFATGIFLGGGLAMILGGLLIKALERVHVALPLLGDARPWQLVFIAVGLPGIAVSFSVWALREPPRIGSASGTDRVPLAEVGAYFRANARTLTCHIVGFTCLAFAGYAGAAWIPTLFIRSYGWSAAEIGVRYGLVALFTGALGSVAGGWLGDRLEARGHRDGKFRVGIAAGLGTIPFGIAFPLVSDGRLALLLLTPGLFFISFVWGLSTAALQEIVPNRMRGVATAVYTGFLNLAGVGLGPTSVALVAQYGLGGPAHLNAAIALVVPAGALASALVFRLGLKPYVVTVERLNGALAPGKTASV
ncbi:MAG: spinster family MFS transporter [SAR324 cluster bacterium]